MRTRSGRAATTSDAGGRDDGDGDDASPRVAASRATAIGARGAASGA